MEASKIYIAPLKKTFSVRHTNKLMKMSCKFQLVMSKMGTIADNDDPDEQFSIASEYAQALTDFPKSALKLTDKQVDALDDTEQDELQKIDVRLALTIQGLSKKDIDATVADMERAGSEVSSEDAKKSTK